MTDPLHGVHVEMTADQVLVSVGGTGLALVITREEWSTFLAEVRDGSHDLRPVAS